nr:MAG: ORF1 [Torque teno midi virus]
MPFWWKRRRKPWFGRWRRFRKPYKKRRYPRRRRRRTTYGRRSRRRRRKRKVRRKKQKIPIQQWQPESIRKCKIKGIGCLVAGAEGRQSFCYTNEIPEYPQPKAPGGGGFGVEVFSLQYFYKQWLARKNIWTKSNDYKELVRYTGTTIRLFRHPTTDFIASYSRTPPFVLEKDYYNSIHPVPMLLARHKKIIPSLKRKPHGRLYVKFKIKPPRQMTTKWFFQSDFADQHLFSLQATACNLGWSYYGQDTQSRLITFRALNEKFYTLTDWSKYGTTHYLPYSTYPSGNLFYWYLDSKGQQIKQPFKPTFSTYNESVNIDKGFFSPKVLGAVKVTTDEEGHNPVHNLPTTICRYNPDIDDGHGNAVWLISTLVNNSYAKPKDTELVIVEKPLWLAFFGFYNFIAKVKKDKGWLLSGIFVVQSPAIQVVTPHTQTIFPIIDNDFMNGKLPWGEYISEARKNTWYPTVENQLITINNFVKTGPYIPKYAYLKESTWNLTYSYTSYFKWGGPYTSDDLVQNPKTQDKWDVPDTLTKTVQVSNPLKQTCQSMLRAWDYRRGIITTTALKRMSKHLEIDSSVQSDDSEPTKKKKKITAEMPYYKEQEEEIQSCLLSLCEEDTYQETENLQQLIQQQQQHQQKLKQNLLKLILDLKNKQRVLQLQSGLE